MTSPEAYLEYLKGRSRRSLLYRRWWLYPRICRHLRGRVLDVGCGIGDMLRYRSDTIGVDVNPAIVAWCQSHGLTAHAMDPDRLPFGDGEFQGALMDNVLEHLDDPVPLLGEIRRVLAPGGVLVVGVPGRRGFAYDADHKRFYDRRSLVDTLAQARFTRRVMFYVPVRSALLDRWLRQYCVYGVFTR